MRATLILLTDAKHCKADLGGEDSYNASHWMVP